MTDSNQRIAIVEKGLSDGNGILRCEAAWVARDFLAPLHRLGLTEEECDVGERGEICERWLCATTNADNAIGPPDEGLSYLAIEGSQAGCLRHGERMTLKEAVEIAGPLIMGEEYARTHQGLGRLAKIYDYCDRLPYHIHQQQPDAAKLGRNSKDEAYYFPEDVDMGPHPETFFGVHPYIVDQGRQELLLPYLEDWDSDLILRHSRAYTNVPGEGFILFSGSLHAPGTALTIELQEDSDVFAMMQALCGGKIISKELLWKDVHPDDRREKGERAVLEQVDWEKCGDPWFYENHHLGPRLIEETATEGAAEYWIYYGTTKFSGKKVAIQPGRTFTSQDKGVYTVLVWRGKGTFDGHEIEGQNFDLDELVVTHEKATRPIEIKNTGSEELMLIKFFGPDVNPGCPMIAKYPAG